MFTMKSSTPPSLPVTSFDNKMNYYQNLNAISSSFDGSRNMPKRTVKFWAAEIYKKNERNCSICGPTLFEG